jgi:hypothetical protein
LERITINRPKYRDQEVGDEFQVNYQRYRVIKQFRAKNGMAKGCLQACLARESERTEPAAPVLVVYDEIVYKHAVSKLDD